MERVDLVGSLGAPPIPSTPIMRYAALLRGIGPTNPNMRNERLRTVVRELGFDNVETVISSGNVLFDSDRRDQAAIEREMEEAWPARLGFQSATLVRSRAQLSRLVEAAPFGSLEHRPETYLLATFCKRPPELEWELPYQAPGKPYRFVAMVDRTLCSVTDMTASATPDVMTWLEKSLGKGISSRTWKTVERILARMDRA